MAENIVDFILRKEGFSSEPYWDNAQWSIGYGSFAGSYDKNNKPNITVNQDQAYKMFQDQIGTYTDRVDKYNDRYNWTPQERDALTSFAYNVGSIDQLTANGTRSKSQIAQKMLEYNKERKNGALVYSQGLADRRKEEQSIFLNGGLDRLTEEAETSVDGRSRAAGVPEEELQPGKEPKSKGSGKRGTSNYQSNILNKYDSFSYQWTIYMVHPLKMDQRKLQELTEGRDSIIISQTGVDDEVSLQSVIQDLFLSFAKENRNAMANNFAVTFLEPGGFTFFNRILYAAKQLGIENHLDACYIMKLDFKGWINDRAIEAPGPFFYSTRLMGLTFDFKDGASTYYGNFVEIKEDAFNRLELHIKEELHIDGVRTFGEFLQELEKRHNEQLEEQLKRNQRQIERDRYLFTTKEAWAGWEFDQVNTAALSQTRGISVTGDGTLKFTFPQGTAINSAIATALFQTRDFKRILTDKGQFIKNDPDEGEADPIKLAELTKWVIFNTDVKYFMYDAMAKRYAKEITYSADSIIAPTLVHDPASFLNLHKDEATQKDRLSNIFDKGLLKKRFDYSFTGLNTEVLDLDVKLDTAYYAIQALNSGALRGVTDVFTGSSFEGQQETNERKQQSTLLQKTLEDKEAALSKLNKEIEDIKSFPQERAFLNDMQQRADQLENEIRTLRVTVKEAEEMYNASLERQREGYSGYSTRLPPASTKYITQSELYSGNKAEANKDMKFRENLPQKFDYVPVNSLANGGPEKKNDDIGSSMLGAMELNLNALADLMQQQIFIRGDPYWLGQSNGAEYLTGGVYYFLNMNFPTYPDNETGLIKSLSSNDPTGQFTITGLYVVQQVQARYDGGEFIMLLKSFRDTNTNNQLTYDELMRGYVR